MDDIEKLQEYIDNSHYIVFFGGAGVSTESGLKDFRGKNGLYKNNNNLKYPPEYMLSSECLFKEPSIFYDYYRQNMDFSKAKPNITHKYLKQLEDKHKLKAIITQNIDGLHQKAGSTNVLELHGTTSRYYCVNCGKEYSCNDIYNIKEVPKCNCGGLIRPDVVLYGEMLPIAYDISIEYITKCDLLIVGGTSLTVFPASGLINLFNGKHLVIINEDKTPYDSKASLVIHKPLGDVFSKLK